MKLWDIRDPANHALTFQGHSESVRDVEFSPFYASYFAAALDNGTLQIWDIRKNTQFERSNTGHDGPVFSVTWHPEDRSLLATGGRDRMIKVWDLMDSQGKPKHTLQTLASVHRLKWRPGHRHVIASAASMHDNKVRLWDVTQPQLPIASLSDHSDVVSGILWFTPNLLLATSKDSTLMLQSVTKAFQHYRYISTVSASWSSDNQLFFCHDPINRNVFNETANNNPKQTTPEAKHILRLFSSPEVDVAYGFDPKLFDHFSRLYRFQGDTPEALLAHNATVATDAGQPQLAAMWEVLAQLVSGIGKEIEAKVEADEKAPAPTESVEYPDTLLKFELEEEYWKADSEPGPTAPPELVPVLAPASEWAAPAFTPWRLQPLVDGLLDQLIEAGDVQTAVVISFILRSKDLCQIDQGLLTVWIVSYIELLQRRNIYAAANEVIRFSDIESVRSANQKSTTIHTGCPHCRKPLYKSGVQCDDCKKRTNVCSICHELVRGLYLWCQTCGHGGHAAHIRYLFPHN
jgi:hypothetical protein